MISRDRTFFGQIFASVAVDLQWAFAEAFDHIDVDRKRWNTCAIFCDRSTSGRRVIMFADVYRTRFEFSGTPLSLWESSLALVKA